MLEIRPIVVNDDMIVLGGNMRLKACKEAGLKEVPIIRASELTEDEQRQFIIKDNVSGGEWDWQMLANEWDDEQLEEWGLDVPEFDTETEIDEKEQKDLSDELKETFEVIISCKDEKNQEQIYNKLIAEGYECRVLTL
jgi:ParB-like chromosome segregation protein Spo0J